MTPRLRQYAPGLLLVRLASLRTDARWQPRVKFMSWGVSAPRFDKALVALAGAQRNETLAFELAKLADADVPLSGQRWLRRLTRTPERRMSVLSS